MHAVSPYYAAHIGLNRVREDLARDLVTVTNVVDGDRIRSRLVAIDAALERLDDSDSRLVLTNHRADRIPINYAAGSLG